MNKREKEEKENKGGEKKNDVPRGPTTGESDVLRVCFS
jgi:hypothetical protein